jgi:hypothetical protein
MAPRSRAADCLAVVVDVAAQRPVERQALPCGVPGQGALAVLRPAVPSPRRAPGRRFRSPTSWRSPPPSAASATGTLHASSADPSPSARARDRSARPDPLPAWESRLADHAGRAGPARRSVCGAPRLRPGGSHSRRGSRHATPEAERRPVARAGAGGGARCARATRQSVPPAEPPLPLGSTNGHPAPVPFAGSSPDHQGRNLGMGQCATTSRVRRPDGRRRQRKERSADARPRLRACSRRSRRRRKARAG